MRNLYLLIFLSLLFNFSAGDCLAAAMVKEQSSVSTVLLEPAAQQQYKREVRSKMHKGKKTFRKKWRNFWKKLKAKFRSKSKVRKQKEARESNRKTEPFSLLSFIFVLIPLLAMVLNSYVFALISVWCFFLSPILAIVGLIRIKKNSVRYKGKMFAIYALVLFAIILTVAIISLFNREG